MLNRFSSYLIKSELQSPTQGLKTLQLMTRNSLKQLNRALESEIEASQDPQASAGRFLDELRQNTTDQTLGFLHSWATFMLRAQQTTNPLDALRDGYQIKSMFNGIQPVLQHTIDTF